MISPEDFMNMSPEERAKVDPLEVFAGSVAFLAMYIDEAAKEKDTLKMMRASMLLLATAKQFGAHVAARLLQKAVEQQAAEQESKVELPKEEVTSNDLTIPGMPKIIGKA